MENSKIEWCDHTFNPWEGCTEVSPGCAHCYAAARNARWNGGTAINWGKGAPRRRTDEANWRKPIKWNRDSVCDVCGATEAAALAGAKCKACGMRGHYGELIRPRVFCASLADWLDDEVPIEWLADLLALIHQTPNLDWLLLTKRPQNWETRMIDAVGRLAINYWVYEWLGGKAPPNVWVGTTVEDQTRANDRIDHLLNIHAKVRFLSVEPMLGPVDLRRCAHCGEREFSQPNPNTLECDFCGKEYGTADLHGWGGESLLQGIDWVICGGESGPGARPMHPEWASDLRDQCKSAGVPFLFKQWGEHVDLDNMPPETYEKSGALSPIYFPDSSRDRGYSACVYRVGKAKAGRLLDGQEWNQFPEVTR